MTVKEFIRSFMSAFQNFKVRRFDIEKNGSIVEYEGKPISDDMPEEVEDMTVHTVIAYKDFLYLCVSKEDEQ